MELKTLKKAIALNDEIKYKDEALARNKILMREIDINTYRVAKGSTTKIDIPFLSAKGYEVDLNVFVMFLKEELKYSENELNILKEKFKQL